MVAVSVVTVDVAVVVNAQLRKERLRNSDVTHPHWRKKSIPLFSFYFNLSDGATLYFPCSYSPKEIYSPQNRYFPR